MSVQAKEQTERPILHDPAAVATTGRLGESALAVLRANGGQGALLVVAPSERRAADLVRVLGALAPDRPALLFPGWDCLPYDRASPSRLVMGRRIAVLKELAAAPDAARILVTTAAAVLQRIPPRSALAGAELTLSPGDAFAREDLEARLQALGYVLDERVDEPGEAALRGQVLDIFPAGSESPVRVEHDGGRIAALRPYDPATQLASGTCESLTVLPASERFGAGPEPSAGPQPGSEHRLAEAFPHLETLFEFLPDAEIVLDAGAEARIGATFEQIRDAYESRTRLRPERQAGERPPRPDALYLTAPEWEERRDARTLTRIVDGADEPDFTPPPFATSPRPYRRFAEFVERARRDRRRVVLAAEAEDLRRLTDALDDGSRPIEPAGSWTSIEDAAPARVLALPLPLPEGFADGESGTVVVAAADVLGSRARSGVEPVAQAAALAPTELEFRIGDVVVHLDRGLGILAGLETVEANGAVAELLRLSYADDETLMVPVDDLDRVWRYGAAPDSVTLDRIDGSAWEKRRAAVEADISASAARLVAAVEDRKAAAAPKLVPPRAAYERFAARFPFTETLDQTTAIAAALADLASGHPMNRLVCGDVGFGKTEVALRAAAAAALAGKQVAVFAPTTVLVRQHVQTFERRFEGFGLAIGHLSRLVGSGEARTVKAGLADGSIRIAIGTHALAGRGVRFKDLGLVIVDEEQRFGAAHKAKLRALARHAHVLTLTATPIPRTLQAALVGLQDLSVIATPPSRRQPIRTFVIPFDGPTVREALMRERGRGGQSFVVCPRIEDVEPMGRRLKDLVPELDTVAVHGRMEADAIDDAMVRFADGDGDVLLATNIIESGLDVPRANTMLIWRPDRFGLAQLHQLRGRVGRGRVRGVAYLLTDPEKPPPRATRKRLETLATLDRLGAGFAISARDLDQRGAGDLFGEEQAGHMKLIGVSLYRHLLEEALAAARGGPQRPKGRPDLNLDLPGHIPADYVPEPEIRINLYARLARLDDEDAVDALEDEIRNRFGDPPVPVRRLLDLARLRAGALRLAVSRVDAGPQAVALTFGDGADPALAERAIAASDGALAWRNGRLVWSFSSEAAEERLAHARKLLRFLDKVESAS